MIAIIDYGVGNLRSVEKAFQYLGKKAEISSDRDFVMNSDAVVLPGVGAFADAAANLDKAGMVEIVRNSINSGKPFLGICLGLQLLFNYSEEGGKRFPGLGILKGAIRQLPAGMNLKVPHMGWNSITYNKNCPVFRNIADNPYFYFVHSFYLDAEDRNIVTARTFYGIEFDAAINSGNVYATQFHPEKSGEAGLNILRDFAELV